MSDSEKMMMNKAMTESRLDEVPNGQGQVGKPINRLEGPLKVTGKATYAAEYALDGLLYGCLVGASIGKGKVVAINEASAKVVHGVQAVIVDLKTFARHPQQGATTKAPTQGVEEIVYFGEPIALVVGNTYEAAREGAAALKVEYAKADGAFDFAFAYAERESAPSGGPDKPSTQGKPEEELAKAAVRVDRVYTTPSQNSVAMEPHACIAHWQGEHLTVYAALQDLGRCKQQLAHALDISVKNIRLIAPYVGGGFGSKLGISPECIAAVIAAQQLNRPVKVVMTRPQVFETTVRRSNTSQRVAIGATTEGYITSIIHDTVGSNLPGENFFEPAGVSTHFLYAGAHRRVDYAMVRMNWLLSGSMRAPGEAVGLMALECAMDELAEQLQLDPIELRRRNEPLDDPSKQRPFSSRQLIEALELGAERFGWHKRSSKPAMQREGDWLIGMGVASAARSHFMTSAEARVVLTRQGTARIETDMTDIGTGTYTILAQIAADMLGLTVEQVEVKLGDTDFPQGSGSGGSWGAGSCGSAVYLACEKLRDKLAERLDVDPDTLQLQHGHVSGVGHYPTFVNRLEEGLAAMGGMINKSLGLQSEAQPESFKASAKEEARSASVTQLLDEDLSTIGKILPGLTYKNYTQASFGAHFAEVGVHVVTGEVRVRRMLGVFAAGRILNEKTARSQCFGGMVFGIGTALMEDLIHDRRDGRIVNHDMAEYHVPVNADVPLLEVIFLQERDPCANPLQSKGIGELGVCGAGAAVANAVYNATGVRVYDFPITLDKLLPALPAL